MLSLVQRDLSFALSILSAYCYFYSAFVLRFLIIVCLSST